jgi:carbamoyl-phosphate synthase large subunit
MRILISAAGSPASVSILRHLRALGHEVVGLNASDDAAALGRAFCDTFHLSPRADDPAYIGFLSSRLAEVELFLPFIDEELVTIARGWHSLDPALRARIAVSAPEVLLDCVDKVRFQEACVRFGLPIAPIATGAPAFYKPRYGRGGRGVIAANDERLFSALLGRDGVLQKTITGEEFTVDAVFALDGRLLATSPRRRITAAGVSTVGEVVPDARLHALALELGTRWSFRYAINFQVIRDAHGHDWLIELNPRLAGSAIFSALAGCDPFAATIAVHRGAPWSGSARSLRVSRFWQEHVEQAPH